MINLSLDKKRLERVVQLAREKGIVIPTLNQQKNPEVIPKKIKNKLRKTELSDLDPINLFRISWKNEPQEFGGLYNGVNYIEIPSELSGVDARIFALVGKYFPTGSHKVGATFGCLAPKLVTGQFLPIKEKAVWPSTGNFCRGGVYNAKLLASESIAVMPENVSQERFKWLNNMGTEIITTTGSGNNVSKVLDKCLEISEKRNNIHIFNQFEEFGNHLWHYEVTGNAMEELLNEIKKKDDRYFGIAISSGSSGTLGSGDYMKEIYPKSKIAVGEALQCSTLLDNGFGSHRIEGISDSHLPWIHNVKNTDMIIAIDDNNTMNLFRLFNTKVGREYLVDQGVSEKFIKKLPFLGISSIANILTAIKMAKYYELNHNDIILTVFTDSMHMYKSRIKEMEKEKQNYNWTSAAVNFQSNLQSITTDNVKELSYRDKKRIHNLKYYTWVKQWGHTEDELNSQWYDYDNYWNSIHKQGLKIDELIKSFNKKVGIL